jgi:hypothetical protein
VEGWLIRAWSIYQPGSQLVLDVPGDRSRLAGPPARRRPALPRGDSLRAVVIFDDVGDAVLFEN